MVVVIGRRRELNPDHPVQPAHPRIDDLKEAAMTSPTTSGSCCTPSGSCGTTPAADIQGGITAVYKVTGMTCGHCEGSISQEIAALAGVASVKAVAATGLVTVTSSGPLDDEAVRAAVDEAGYEFTGRA